MSMGCNRPKTYDHLASDWLALIGSFLFLSGFISHVVNIWTSLYSHTKTQTLSRCKRDVCRWNEVQLGAFSSSFFFCLSSSCYGTEALYLCGSGVTALPILETLKHWEIIDVSKYEIYHFRVRLLNQSNSSCKLEVMTPPPESWVRHKFDGTQKC